MTILEADDLYRFFHPGDTEVRALRGASLRVARGETVALVGPSGSGKSTFLACVAGVDEPDGGVVSIDGARMTRRPESERAALRARALGFMAQSRNLFAHLTVAENMRLQLGMSGRPVDADRIDALLGSVGLRPRRNALPGALSGGESARAALAVALANDPLLLIADEPTAEVDRETESEILDVLELRRRRGGASLIATHSIALAARATRVVTISDGRMNEGGGSTPVARSEPPPSSSEGSDGALLVEAHGLARSYFIGGERIDALLPVDFSIRSRQRIGLVGRSGSGKSTLLNLLAGLTDPSDRAALAWPGFDSSRLLRPQQIGVVFQTPSLIPALSVLENVQLPLDLASENCADSMNPREALERLSLSNLSDKLPDHLSGGQMQRVALARALVTRPKLLLADEPTGQLDHDTGRAVIRALLAAIEDTDAALVVATHDPAIAEFLNERWLMDSGRLTIVPREREAA